MSGLVSDRQILARLAALEAAIVDLTEAVRALAIAAPDGEFVRDWLRRLELDQEKREREWRGL